MVIGILDFKETVNNFFCKMILGKLQYNYRNQNFNLTKYMSKVAIKF